MDLSGKSSQNLAQAVKPTLYNNDPSQQLLQQLSKISFFKKRKHASNLNPHSQINLYSNDQFIPKLASKHLANTPKFLFSLQRKRLRMKNGISSRSAMNQPRQRNYFKPQRPPRLITKVHKQVERCKHTHQVHTAQKPQWCIVPPLKIYNKQQLPHFMFNMHHMQDESAGQLTPQVYQHRTAKGANTMYYGCSSSHRKRGSSVQSARSALTSTKRSMFPYSDYIE